MDVVVRRDDEHETTVKGNDADRWISDDLVLYLTRRQNGDAIE
jgi:hypothetical protein